jgi:hypothetical protein
MGDINIPAKPAVGGGFVTSVSSDAEVAKTNAKKRKHVGVTDTTSTASLAGQTVSFIGIDAGKPKLVNPNNMTDAQMIELIGNALAKSNRQRIVTAASQSQFQMQSSFQTTSIAVAPPPDSSSSSSKSSSTDSTASTETSSTNQSSQSSQSSSTQSSSSNAASNTVLVGVTKSYMALTTTLSDAINERLDKKLKKRLPHQTMNQVQEFLNSMVQNAQVALIVPALAELGKVGKTNFRTDVGAVDTATAVQFGIQMQNAIASGDVKAFANSILPQDPLAAKQLAAVMETVLVDAANVQTGSALNLPGFANQVGLQAQVVRDQQTAYSSNLDQVTANTVNQLVLNGTIPADQQVSMEASVKAALQATTSGGPYTTRTDLMAALEASFTKQFPDNATLVSLLVSTADQQSFSIATDGKSVYLPTFNADNINIAKTQDSLKQAILQAFAKSQEEVNAAAKAKAIVDEVLASDRLSRYNSEQDVRDAIKSALQTELSAEEITSEQADAIAAGTDLGIPPDPANPLYNGSGTTVIAPWSYSGAVQTAYQDTVHIAPSSDLGEDLNQIAGVAPGLTGLSSTQLLNEAYAAADSSTRSYLNLTPDEAAQVARNQLTDPAKVIQNLGDFLNSPQLPSNFQQARFV